MKITRRKFIMTTSVLGVSGIGTNLVMASEQADQKAIKTSIKLITDNLSQYFTKAGYVAVPAAPIISGISFNGGLNYDENLPKSQKAIYVIQPSSRIEDIAKKNQKGSLPLFTIFGIANASNNNQVEHTKLVFTYLISVLRLNPKLMSITSTELIKPLLPTLASYGIAENQIQLRPLAEAKKIGDGSGWFAPAGHPQTPNVPTYSVEYQMPDGRQIEIAELPIGLNAGGFGIERLAMAKNQAYLSWNDCLPQFKDLVQVDAQKNRQTLPIGYYEISGLPKPA